MSDVPLGAGPFAKLLGVSAARVLAEGGLEIEMEAREDHYNVGGIVHGGVVTSLLDMAMGGAVVLTLAPDEWCATETITVNMLRPATAGKLVARARIERRGKLTAFPIGELLDERGQLLARATGVWAVRKG